MNTSYKHNVYLLRSAAFIVEFIYFIFTSCTTHSAYFCCRGLVQSISLFLCSTTGSIEKDKRIIIWVVAPPSSRISPPTNSLDYSAHELHHRPVGPTIRCPLLLRHSLHHRSDCSLLWFHRQLRQGLASYAGDSSALGFFVQELSAKLGTPLAFGFCYVSSMCFQVASCCSYQGADLGQHVWDLDKYMTDGVGKLSDLFSLTLL